MRAQKNAAGCCKTFENLRDNLRSSGVWTWHFRLLLRLVVSRTWRPFNPNDIPDPGQVSLFNQNLGKLIYASGFTAHFGLTQTLLTPALVTLIRTTVGGSHLGKGTINGDTAYMTAGGCKGAEGYRVTSLKSR